MRSYLQATGRAGVAKAADAAAAQGFLNADEGAEYDEVIEIVRLTSSSSVPFCYCTSKLY
jgi:aconitase A